MAKFKVGDKVRYISGAWYEQGTELYVLANDGTKYQSILIGDSPQASEYDMESMWVDACELEIIKKYEESPQNDEEHEYLHARINTLEARVLELEAKLGDNDEKDDLFDPLTYFDFSMFAPTKTSNERRNERRKEVIAKAKKFVEDTEKLAEYNPVQIGNATLRRYKSRPEYVINEEKRTVVVLAYGMGNGQLYVKGIAKCDPSDVFNVDIGKAIALGRAYGLDTTVFEMAPQPDEVVEGMVVKAREHSLYVTEPFLVKFVRDDNAHEEERGWVPTELAEIVSDSEAEY